MTTINEQTAEVEYWFKEKGADYYLVFISIQGQEKGEVIHGPRRDVENQLREYGIDELFEPNH